MAGNKKIPLTETEKEVLKLMRSRHELGRKRYGVGISFKQDPRPYRWIEEALEELCDMIQYLVACKMCLQELEKKGLKVNKNDS